MTVKTTNRPHRITYLVIVLVFAVTLSTALVLAGERNANREKKNAGCQGIGRAHAAHLYTRSMECAVA